MDLIFLSVSRSESAVISGGVGPVPGTLGAPPWTFGEPAGTVGEPPWTFGEPSGTVGEPPMTFGEPAGTVGEPPWLVPLADLTADGLETGVIAGITAAAGVPSVVFNLEHRYRRQQKNNH